MTLISPTSPRLAVVAASVLLAASFPAEAFSVTAAHGHSTYDALQQWAAETGYEVIWEPRMASGIVNFPAPARDVHEDFHAAVEALVSGAAYGRRNVYCATPSEYQAHAIIDDNLRMIYVIGRPTGNRCTVRYP